MKKPALAFFCLTAISCSLFAEKNNEEKTKKKQKYDEVVYNWSRTFAETLEIAGKKHYKVADPEQCMISAINSFLNCLDPHSSFLSPKTYKSMLESTSGEFFGIGIIIDNTRETKDKFLTVIDTIPSGPSDKAGLKPYDKIIEIDGKAIEGISTEEATSKLKGERHTVVHVKILREGKPDLLSFDIKRDIIKEQSSLSFYIKNQNIYYLSLSVFGSNSFSQLESLLKKARKKEYKALILDLRNNSGGLLNSAVDIASLFLEKGSSVVVTKNKHNKVTEEYKTSRKPIANDALPIFILINNYTASAAEILAGCLKIHSDNLSKIAEDKPQKKLMVFLVGEKTFGKGSVQEVIPVSNNCAVKLTTSLYYLPNDTSIQQIGIIPDFLIAKKFPPTKQATWFTKFYGRERALKGSIKPQDAPKDDAVDKKKKRDDKKQAWADRAKKMLSEDNQLRNTITLINIMHTAQTSCPENVSSRHKAIKFIKQNDITNEKLLMIEIKG